MNHREKRIKKLRTEFLPEALEIAEKPASPMGGAIIITVFLVIAAFVIWACIGRIDEVAAARGRFVPIDGTCQVQANGNGVITKVHVKEGDRVHRGDLLYTMDKEMDRISIAYSEDNIGLDRLRIELLDQMIRGRDISPYMEGDYSSAQQEVISYMISLDRQDGISIREYEVAAENAKNQYQLAQNGLKLREERKNHVSREQDVQAEGKKLGSAQQVELDRLKEQHAYLKQEAERYKALYEAGAKARKEWEAKVQERDNAAAQVKMKEIELGKEGLAEQESGLSLEYQAGEADADYENQEGAASAAKSSYDAALLNLENAKVQRNSRLMELRAQYEAELKQYGVTVEEQYYQYENRDITAPYDGIVKELYVDKEGSVVAAAQVVAEILPEKQELVVEAEIQNTDIGFVEPGQEADIKIDTYNYQKYGRLQGKVAYISPDAIENERGEQTYRAEIAVAGDSLPGTELSSGMQCSVEVKTDRRRVIAFFLEPLADALDHSLKVR